MNAAESLEPSRDRLWNRLSAPWRWGLLAMLVVSLAANVAALLVPFLELKEAFHASLSYELPAAVKLMWQQGLPVVAVLILVFSILFPLTKLAGLFSALLLRWTPRRRRGMVRWLATLGRWSLLDVFVVMLLMVLASGQWAISTQVRPGVHLFMVAIGLAMIVAEIMSSFEEEADREGSSGAGPATALARAGWATRISIPLLLAGSAIALAIALVAPILKIDQFLLSSNAYSVGSAIGALWHDGQAVFAILMGALLGVVPATRLLLLLGAWVLPVGPRRSGSLAATAGLVGRFSGLEVFGLALFLVLVEGHDLIKTEIESGAWFLLVAIGLDAAFSLAARRALGPLRPRTGRVAS